MVAELTDIDDKIQYVIDVILKEAKLEDLMVKQSLYAMLSAYTDNPLNVKVEAPTGEGKNWVLGKVSDLFPKEDVMNLAGMTDKALYHRMGKMVIKNEKNGEYDDAEQIIKDRESELKEINKELECTKNIKDRLQYETQKELIEDELKDVKKNLAKLILISHKILMYLDTPRQGLINNLMSMLGHDNYEVEYDYVDTNNGIKTKVNILRGWPAFFYAQALDTSYYKRDAETSRRFVKVNPKMTKEKYKAAAELIAQKWGMPDFMYQALVVSDAEKERARQIIREIKENLLSISGVIKPGSNNVITPFSMAISDVLDTRNAKDVNAVKRLFAWLSLLPIIRLEKRPRIIIRREGQIIREVMPFALIEDLKEAIYLMEYTSGVRPNLLQWLEDVFTITFNDKREADYKAVGDSVITEDRKAVTTDELVTATERIHGKILTAQQIYETYLRPLIRAGYIDSQRSNIHGRNHIYWLTGLSSKDDNSLIVSLLGRKTINDDDASGINLGNFTLKSCAEYIEKVVSSSSSGSVFCKILDHEGNEITIDQLVERYYSFENKGVDDHQETEAKRSPFDQTEPIEERRKPENEKNDQRSTNLPPPITTRLYDSMIGRKITTTSQPCGGEISLRPSKNYNWSCNYCNFQTDDENDYNHHVVNRHPRKSGYNENNPNGEGYH